MSHGRKIIRSAIATILRMSPVAWSSVQETRIESPRQIWPYVMVFAESESSELETIGQVGIYERTALITVVGLLRLPGTGDTISIEDKMDVMAVEIETKLTRSTLGAVIRVGTLSLIATKMDVIIEEDGIDHAELNMTWSVTYSTAEGASEVLI